MTGAVGAWRSTPVEELRAVAKALTLEKCFDLLADLDMPGRSGMDAITQQLLIGPVGGPGADEFKGGDGAAPARRPQP